MEKPNRLPPLGMLRIFEAAARLGSFTVAARELAVTHSAVSHQIRALEELLGFSLFHREGRGVRLTVLGQDFAAHVNQALCSMGRGLVQVRKRANPNRLTVTTMPSFATCWLTPRLAGFLAQHPGTDFTLLATDTVLDFARDGIDIAIRCGQGNYPGMQTRPLIKEEMLVVASPSLLGQKQVESVEALADWPLLRTEGESWITLFSAVGLDWDEPQGGLYINDSSLVLQAAIHGMGIALARRSLCQGYLDAGLLRQVLPITVPSSLGYWFVTPARLQAGTLAEAFHDWLFKELSHWPGRSDEVTEANASCA